MKRKSTRKTREQIREEVLRPLPSLGYDHDELALYLITRRAYTLAERELRRAIWLNPYEPVFMEHLVECLLESRRYAEALEEAQNLPEGSPIRIRALARLKTVS